jgi:hypothetical protein
VKQIRLQMESISGVYDDLNEKMHDVDKSMYVVQQATLERPCAKNPMLTFPSVKAVEVATALLANTGRITTYLSLSHFLFLCMRGVVFLPLLAVGMIFGLPLCMCSMYCNVLLFIQVHCFKIVCLEALGRWEIKVAKPII